MCEKDVDKINLTKLSKKKYNDGNIHHLVNHRYLFPYMFNCYISS